MKYVIWKIDDSRKTYTDKIKSAVSYERVYVDCVNGREVDLKEELMSRGLSDRFSDLNTPGETGVWLTFLNTMEFVADQSEGVITFEDDALLCSDFISVFESRIESLPNDFDFFSLFIPRDHTHWSDYSPKMDEDGLIVDGQHKLVGRKWRQKSPDIYKPWQRYGGVSMLWSPNGAKKVLSLVKDKTFAQWDEFVYARDRLGYLNGYTSNPDRVDLVYISEAEKSTVH